MSTIQTPFLLTPDAVNFAAAEGKPAALDLLAGQFEQAYGFDRVQVCEALEMREKLGSTGFGHGAAIPHARIGSAEQPAVALIKLTQPVDFGAADNVPVSLLIGLLSPRDGGAVHLQALASISRILRDDGHLGRLLAAQNRDALIGVVTNLWEQNSV